MAPESETGLEIVEHAHITPAAGDDDDVILPEGETPEEGEEPEGGEEGDEPETPPGKKEHIVRREPAAPAPEGEEPPAGGEIPPAGDDDDLSEVPGETPRERGMRLEIKRLKNANRKERVTELLGTPPAPAPSAKKEIDPAKAAILQKYKPEEIQSLREVLPLLAEEMGYVRGDQLASQTYAEKAESELSTFIDKHPEYLPENDKDNLLWGRFAQEYGMYKQPANPKDFTKIFNRIHKDIFGITSKGAGGTPAANAARSKVQSASHAGASGTTHPAAPASKQNSSGLRLDMLKGFSEEDIAEMTG